MKNFKIINDDWIEISDKNNISIFAGYPNEYKLYIRVSSIELIETFDIDKREYHIVLSGNFESKDLTYGELIEFENDLLILKNQIFK